MKLVVLDTNVVVSAVITPDGAAAMLISDWVLKEQIQIITSPWIVEEYQEAAQRPKFRRYGFPPLWLDFLIEGSLRLSDSKFWPDPCPNPKDTQFLALAHASGAWLVTGNLKHFPASLRHGVTVLSPAKYLTHLTAQ
jgi:putative PIN family toxin of toxin-antitoxin system